MRARLAHLWSSLWPDPATTSLGWWLVAIHLGLVLLVGGGISWYASGMLRDLADQQGKARVQLAADRKSTRLNSSHQIISYAVFCLKKKNRWLNPPNELYE